MINRFIIAFHFAARGRRFHTFHQTMRNPRPKGLRAEWRLARWIVTAHGGTIQITSEPNRLTTATVRLPLA
jgi:nitrogen-specific signal transduction histidine kinase